MTQFMRKYHNEQSKIDDVGRMISLLIIVISTKDIVISDKEIA
jgi:hypothetical protein